MLLFRLLRQVLGRHLRQLLRLLPRLHQLNRELHVVDCVRFVLRARLLRRLWRQALVRAGRLVARRSCHVACLARHVLAAITLYRAVGGVGHRLLILLLANLLHTRIRIRAHRMI